MFHERKKYISTQKPGLFENRRRKEKPHPERRPPEVRGENKCKESPEIVEEKNHHKGEGR